MVNRCVAMFCGNSGATGHSTYRFPKDTGCRRLWVKFVQTKRANFQSPSTFSVICESHFSEECFENLMQVQLGFAKLKLLKQNSVPTMQADPPDKREPSKRPSDGQACDCSVPTVKKPRQSFAIRKRLVHQVLAETTIAVTPPAEAEGCKLSSEENTDPDPVCTGSNQGVSIIVTKTTGTQCGLKRPFFRSKGILQLLLGDSHSHHGTMQSPGVSTVHVCLTSDSNTLIGTIATINSVRLHANHPVMFHLVTDSAETANHLKNWIESTELRAITYELRVFDHELVQDKIRVRTGRQELAKPMNYARFYYADIFPKLNGRVIHLDDDVIVQGDVYDLAHTHLKSDHVAAFSDDCTSNNKRFTYLINKYSSYLNFRHAAIKSLHLDPNACSFNTGVYVVDIDLWRKLNITKQLEYWMTLNTMDDIYGNERAGGGSQPPVMIVLYNRYSLLDPLWHVRHLGMTPSRRYGDHFIQHAKLLHWNGRYKPWDGVAMFSDIWDLYFLHDPRGKYVPVRRTLIQNKKE